MVLADFNRNALRGDDLRDYPYGEDGVRKLSNADLVNFALDTVHEFNEWFIDHVIVRD